ncbi:hypothetical protein F4801DRAFT_205309 [Xylaria longipes]|nr:hypothetical protein F4801DRAFT_205309 [Xylaria longipes]RYC65685.1 hypothetical protein CHU98_g519 [Xylaria longipes]
MCCRQNKTPGRGNYKVPGVPATTFTVFSNLPTELRLMIWEEFVRTPRIIRIDQTGKYDKKHREGQFTIEINGLVREQACPLLGTCRESRSVTVKSILLFTIGSTDPTISPYIEVRHFAITSCDIAFFSGSTTGFYNIDAQGETNKIANIMLGESVRAIYGNTDSSESIWANWLSFGYSALRLSQKLGNRQYLENIYGLVHRTNIDTGAVERFEMDELCGFVPSLPPEYRRGVADWLKHAFVEEREWDLMSQPALKPHLLMRDSELKPWVRSKQVLVTRKKGCP